MGGISQLVLYPQVGTAQIERVGARIQAFIEAMGGF